ncbi:MAG TPA: hypothetical protein VMW25_05620 [Clostridia bacterium]|nr:hypothetical protein [Clostridia bacterium]
MRPIESKLRRLSRNQLRALAILSRSKSGLVSSSPAGESMGITGKALGGLFSSLARQKINNQPLLIPCGQGEIGRGLRWKLNLKIVSLSELKEIVDELLSSWE